MMESAPHPRTLRHAPLTPPNDLVLLKTRPNLAAEERRGDPKHAEEPVLVYARWAGCVGGRALPSSPLEKKRHVYSTSIPPEKPLCLGMRVRILATSPAWYSAPEEDPDDSYDTYDAHVVGAITGIAGWKGRKIVLEVRNECMVNTVETVRLRLPFVPEVTVQLDADAVPAGQREAQETDLNTLAVVRARAGDARCGGCMCWMPWRRLVGEGFLWEPMVDDVGERPGIKPGRKKFFPTFVGWKEAREAEAAGTWGAANQLDGAAPLAVLPAFGIA
ncbi:hypothetical protein K466DRAFT_567470 [Polyporus arcularius HHB13444]|uniref:Uncharacterized protein n=1 Tax=Polyporus arcularius HHB13444 TaxID=1314778 RepID=A0A5C3P463_9APHY|nr:hypothetical protein K466DRAFT_567470 [Polyporus arcularius HHB13444]